MMPKPRVLVIEDDPLHRELARELLLAHGYTVISAGDARSGLDLARDERPELILMDVQLPGMDGLAATRQLRADPDCEHIPIIAVTAHAMDSDRREAFLAGCDAYISKPFNTRTLPALLARMIEAGRI